MKIRKSLILSLLSAIVACLFTLAPTATAAAASNFNNAACNGAAVVSGGNCPGSGKAATDSINNVIRTAIIILSVIVGVAAVVMIIVSGLRFITSNGDASSIASAKSGLTWALIGLVVVGLAQFIVHFVLNSAANGLK
jgi:hypothetical protein